MSWSTEPIFITRRVDRALITAAGPLELARFGPRVGAFLIDYFIYSAVASPVFLLIVSARSDTDAFLTESRRAPLDDHAIATLVLSIAITWVLWGIFSWVFNSIGWSPGKRAIGLRIVTQQGSRPGALTGLLRTVAAVLSLAPYGLGYAWSAWDRRKQTWHDKVAGTYVVRL